MDSVLSQVYGFIIGGWTTVGDPTFAPFKSKCDELTTQKGCILWGTRVVVPPSLQEKVLQELHDTHPGMSKNESLGKILFGGLILILTLRELFLPATLASP